MTPAQFIEARLAALRTPSERITFKNNDALIEHIYKAVMSKKFRKYSCTPKQQSGIRVAIALNVAKKQPIQFIFPFGAYKLWRLAETPEPDWAELFALMYYTRWLKQIADSYDPGVEFVFSSDEIIVERMNNISKEETAAYAAGLNKLFLFLAKRTPPNIRFSLFPIGSLYTELEFESDLVARSDEYMRQNGGYRELPEDERRSIELNVRLLPGQDQDPLWREKIDVIHNSYYAVLDRKPYLSAPEKIMVFPTPLTGYTCIATGTTKKSIAKFWVGVGALQKRDDSYIETILSPSQLEKAVCSEEAISIEGLEGKNFKTIRVLK